MDKDVGYFSWFVIDAGGPSLPLTLGWCSKWAHWPGCCKNASWAIDKELVSKQNSPMVSTLVPASTFLSIVFQPWLASVMKYNSRTGREKENFPLPVAFGYGVLSHTAVETLTNILSTPLWLSKHKLKDLRITAEKLSSYRHTCILPDSSTSAEVLVS